MKKLFGIIAIFCLNLSLVAVQTKTDQINSFAKKHETKLAVAAAALAGTGLGSYITYYLCVRRINQLMYTLPQEKDSSVKSEAKATQTIVESNNYKDRLAALLKAEFERYFKGEKCTSLAKAIGNWEVAVTIENEGFSVMLKGEKNIFSDTAPEWHNAVINEWPLWKHQHIKELSSFTFSCGSFTRSFKFYDHVFRYENGWKYVPR